MIVAADVTLRTGERPTRCEMGCHGMGILKV